MAERFRILFVCTGNVCRSPMAQAMLSQRLRAGHDPRVTAIFEVESAGTAALTAEHMERNAIDALAAIGVTAENIIARNVTKQHIVDADLILAATRQHRAAVVTMVPSAGRRTFTIREFARLTAAGSAESSLADPVARARAIVGRAAADRGVVLPAHPRDDDLDDPYGQPLSAFTRTAATLDACVAVIAETLVS